MVPRTHDDFAELAARAVEERRELVGLTTNKSASGHSGLVDQLDVVPDVAAVFSEYPGCKAHHELRLGAEHPIPNIHLVRGELGRQPPDMER